MTGSAIGGLGVTPASLTFQFRDMGYVTQFLISVAMLLSKEMSVKVFYKTLIPFPYLHTILVHKGLSHCLFQAVFLNFSILLSFPLALRLLALCLFGSSI